MTETADDLIKPELMEGAPPLPKRPHRRTKPLPTHPNGQPDRLEQMQAELDELRAELRASGQVAQYVRSAPPPAAQGRVADDEELTPWQLELRRQTSAREPREMVRSEPAFNAPPRWFMKSDGSVVSLQGDARNVAYYTDVKGFRVLSKAEEKQYLAVEKPKIVRIQQARANLINGIRRAVQLDLVLQAGLDPSWELDLERMTIAELQAQFDAIAATPTADGRPRRMFTRLPRLQDADDRRAEAEAKRLLEGVETTPSRGDRGALEAIEAQLRQQQQLRGGGRTIEVTRDNVNTFA